MGVFWVGSQCSDFELRFGLSIVCQQLDLKIGGGRIFFKGFLIFSYFISSVVYLHSLCFLFGMAHRSRAQISRRLNALLEKEANKILEKEKLEKSMTLFCASAKVLLEHQSQTIERVHSNMHPSTGKHTSTGMYSSSHLVI